MNPLSTVSTCSNNIHSHVTKACLRKEERVCTQQQQHIEIKFLKRLASPLIAGILTLSTPCLISTQAVSLAQAIDAPRGAALFQRACIGCHVGGGNIIQPGSTLLDKDLERNGVATEDGIYNITYYGKGRMPDRNISPLRSRRPRRHTLLTLMGFGEKCTPRGQCTFGPRLQDEEIKLLAEFVKLQAEKGWPNIELSEE